MIFYSKEIGKDGEKDYIDTNDFADVMLIANKILYSKEYNKSIKADVLYSLIYKEETNEIVMQGEFKSCDINIIESSDAIDPEDFITQGADAYYNNTVLDEIIVLKTAKEQIFNNIKDALAKQNCIINNADYDYICKLYVDDKPTCILDGVKFDAIASTIEFSRYYTLSGVSTIPEGKGELYVNSNKVINFTFRNFNIKSNLALIALTGEEVLDDPVIFTRNSLLTDREDYDNDRIKYLLNDSSEEEEIEIDDFEDLF